MPPLSLPAKIALASLLGTLALSLVFLGAEVATAKDLGTAQKVRWVLALAVGTFFTAVIYFAQGRTGKLGRMASVLLALGIALALGLVVALTLRL